MFDDVVCANVIYGIVGPRPRFCEVCHEYAGALDNIYIDEAVQSCCRGPEIKFDFCVCRAAEACFIVRGCLMVAEQSEFDFLATCSRQLLDVGNDTFVVCCLQRCHATSATPGLDLDKARSIIHRAPVSG